MQIDRILKPCAACGESLIFGHFAPQGDVLKLNQGWSRVRCPACRTLGPVRASFRDACDSWNAVSGGAAAGKAPAAPWRIPASGGGREDTLSA